MLVYNLGHDAGLPSVSCHRQAFYVERAVSADVVLRYLEERLTATFLTKWSGDQRRLQALLILVFGVMRSLAYSDDTEVVVFSEVRRPAST